MWNVRGVVNSHERFRLLKRVAECPYGTVETLVLLFCVERIDVDIWFPPNCNGIVDWLLFEGFAFYWVLW